MIDGCGTALLYSRLQKKEKRLESVDSLKTEFVITINETQYAGTNKLL